MNNITIPEENTKSELEIYTKDVHDLISELSKYSRVTNDNVKEINDKNKEAQEKIEEIFEIIGTMGNENNININDNEKIDKLRFEILHLEHKIISINNMINTFYVQEQQNEMDKKLSNTTLTILTVVFTIGIVTSSVTCVQYLHNVYELLLLLVTEVLLFVSTFLTIDILNFSRYDERRRVCRKDVFTIVVLLVILVVLLAISNCCIVNKYLIHCNRKI